MTTISLWILVSLTNAHYGGVPYSKVEQFVSQKDCMEFRSALIAAEYDGRENLKVRLACIQGKVVR